MDLSLILKLLGGLALFLYGMQMMSDGLEKAAGDRLKTILEKLTSNRILGVIVGALITAAIQSSSATTVMVIFNNGFIFAARPQHGNVHMSNASTPERIGSSLS